LLGPARAPGEPLESRHENLARSLQAVYEECAFHVLNALWSRTKNPRLCLAGGCAMNSVANGKVRENTPFQDIYIQPAAADSGTRFAVKNGWLPAPKLWAVNSIGSITHGGHHLLIAVMSHYNYSEGGGISVVEGVAQKAAGAVTAYRASTSG